VFFGLCRPLSFLDEFKCLNQQTDSIVDMFCIINSEILFFLHKQQNLSSQPQTINLSFWIQK
jgi:hypothetical protein